MLLGASRPASPSPSSVYGIGLEQLTLMTRDRNLFVLEECGGVNLLFSILSVIILCGYLMFTALS